MLSHSECLISGHAVFEGNKAFTDGGAIDATPSSLIIKSNEFYLHNNSEYINSECFSKSYSQSILFCNNSAGGWGGAVELEDSNMSLTRSVVFMANEASDGGGIDITYTTDLRKCSPNYIIFEEPLDLIFHANLATRSGGALYICDSYLDCRLAKYSIINRFFIVNGSINSVNLNFTDNKASDGGSSIYGGANQYCQVDVKSKKMHGYLVFQNLTKTSIEI